MNIFANKEELELKKKVLGLILTGAMLVTSLTACGGNSNTAKSSAEKTSSAKASTMQSKTTSNQADAGGKLVYWSMWEATEPQGKVIKEAADKFSADTGVEVDLQFKGRTGIREGLQPALDSGTVIDMFDEDIDRVNTTFGKYLMDLEELAKAADYEKTANAGLIAACREVGGGKLMSIPYQPNLFAFFYNKDIFKQAGISAVPTTWEEFVDAAKKVKAAGFDAITSDDAYIVSMFGYHLSHLVGAEKAIDIVKNGKWDDPAVMQTAKDYEALAKDGLFSAQIGGNVWPAGQNTELAGGTAAMYLNGSWLPNEVRDIATFEWGCFGYPSLKGGVDGPEAANYGAQVLAINKDSKQAENAFKLITYITKGEFDAKLSKESIGIPADSTNTEWPELLKDVKPVMDSLKTRYVWAAGAEANENMTPIIKENFQKLCAGNMSADEFVAALKAAGK